MKRPAVHKRLLRKRRAHNRRRHARLIKYPVRITLGEQ